MQRTITMILGIVVAAVVAFTAVTGGNSTATPDVAQAPKTGGPTPLAPPGMEEDVSDPVLFIEGEPVYDLDSIPVYDEDGNLIPNPHSTP